LVILVCECRHKTNDHILDKKDFHNPYKNCNKCSCEKYKEFKDDNNKFKIFTNGIYHYPSYTNCGTYHTGHGSEHENSSALCWFKCSEGCGGLEHGEMGYVNKVKLLRIKCDKCGNQREKTLKEHE
jgi:hypothetical protein